MRRCLTDNPLKNCGPAASAGKDTGGGACATRPGGGRSGQALMDMALGTCLIVVTVLGIVTAVAVQGRSAVVLVRQSQAVLLLEGEIETMRAAPADRLQPCADEPFTPALPVPGSLAYTEFRRTVAVEQDTGLANVRLEALLPGRPTGGRRVTVEAAIWMGGTAP